MTVGVTRITALACLVVYTTVHQGSACEILRQGLVGLLFVYIIYSIESFPG